MRVLMIGLLVLTLAACTQESEDTELTITTTTTTTTTTAGQVTTTIEPVESDDEDDGDDGDESETTAQVGMAVEAYDIAVRSSTPEGEVLHVVINPGTYTDIDLENFVVVTLDERDLAELHVYDDRDAVDAAIIEAEERTETEQDLVDDHYLVSFADGNVITFQGPFSEVGSVRIGS